MFTKSGPSEDDVNKPVLPAFLETEPGSYKPLEKWTRAEIEAQLMSRGDRAAPQQEITIDQWSSS